MFANYNAAPPPHRSETRGGGGFGFSFMLRMAAASQKGPKKCCQAIGNFFCLFSSCYIFLYIYTNLLYFRYFIILRFHLNGTTTTELKRWPSPLGDIFDNHHHFRQVHHPQKKYRYYFSHNIGFFPSCY